MTKKKKTAPGAPVDAPLVAAAIRLQEATLNIETLTRRAAKLELASRNDLMRAGELMKNAADGHEEFLKHLNALSDAVGDLRERQNASARILTHEAERLDERRKQYEALEQKFGALGGGARELTDLFAKEIAIPGNGAPADREALAEKLAEAEKKLSQAVESARDLAADARDAGFVELERQAQAMSQQLHALHQKFDKLRDAVLS